MLILISAGEASGEMYGAQLIEALRRAAADVNLPILSRRSGETRMGQPPSVAGENPAELRSAGQPGAAVPTQTFGSRQASAAVPTQTFGSRQASAAVPTLSFFGVGGDRMRAAGCETIIDAKDLAVVGITEIVSHLPKILGLYKNLIREADRRKPDLAIVIDSPAFNWRVARQMKKRGIPTVYYVAPQFWAWRQGRVRLIRNYIDKALVIFPFEEQFYRKRGVDATFVGHPLAELPAPTITRVEYATQFHLDPKKPWITLMPGSRVKEVRMNLPTILEAATILGDGFEFLLPVAPTLDREFLAGVLQNYPQALKRDQAFSISSARVNSCPSQEREIEPSAAKAANNSDKPAVRLEAAPFQGETGSRMVPQSSSRIGPITLVPESLPALHHSRAGIIASGTATIEAAMMNLPFAMVYRVSPLTYLLGKPRVKVPRFAMVNLIAGKEVVPELVQHHFTATNVVTRINEILPDGPARNRMLEGLGSVSASLRAPDASRIHRPPADRAAEIILDLAEILSRGSGRQKTGK